MWFSFFPRGAGGSFGKKEKAIEDQYFHNLVSTLYVVELVQLGLLKVSYLYSKEVPELTLHFSTLDVISI